MTPIERLLARLPGIGEARARALAKAVGEQPQDYRDALARAIQGHHGPRPCPVCGDESPDCASRHNRMGIMVVRHARDREAMDRARCWPGGYHVLRGLLDEAHGVGPAQLTTRALLVRLRSPLVKEVVLGLGGTEQGKRTTEWLAGLLRHLVPVWTLGTGVRTGGTIEHATTEELVAALRDRWCVRP